MVFRELGSTKKGRACSLGWKYLIGQKNQNAGVSFIGISLEL